MKLNLDTGTYAEWIQWCEEQLRLVEQFRKEELCQK